MGAISVPRSAERLPDDILRLSDRLWNGQTSIVDHHPVSLSFAGGLVEVASAHAGATTRIGFIPSFANVTVVRTGDGLVLIDTGSALVAQDVHGEIRRWAAASERERVHAAVYTHGHIDHVFGMGPHDEEAAGNGWPAPLVVAHQAVPERFDRYVLTAGYNSVINQWQFQLPAFSWPTTYRYPDLTYHDRLDLEVGGTTFELHHGRGETDDHTWVWIPSCRVLCTGDLFIWASPNAGNPQKVQRYPREWADALREMDRLGAEVLLPGHGLPIMGNARVHQALADTAELLESLCDQVLEMMNRGASLDDVIHSVTPPSALLARPYLTPIYDDPEFVVHSIWRRYGGWYDGDPASLKPARRSQVAAELAALAGGARVLSARARELAEEGDLRLSGHLAELAALAAPGDPSVLTVRAEVYDQRASAESSTMARGIFAATAAESRAAAEAANATSTPPGGRESSTPPGGRESSTPPGRSRSQHPFTVGPEGR